MRAIRSAAAAGCILFAGVMRASAQAGIEAGRVEQHDVTSKQLGRERRVWVYTPPRYSSASTYDLLIAFDGADYQHDIPLPSMLDSLIAAKKIPPFVALLIDNSEGAARLADLANQPRFLSFLGDELIPWLRQHWTVTRDPHRTIVTGSSAGGLGAAYVALERPDLFGNVLSQSGAFWRGFAGSNDAPYEYLTKHVATIPKRDITFFLDVGALETHATLGGSGPVFIDANRRFRNALKAKGYALTYTEVPGGQHAPQFWKERLPVGLVAMAGAWR